MMKKCIVISNDLEVLVTKYSAELTRIYICELIWEKGPYRAKTKLKLRVDTPVKVNLVKKIFFVV